MKDEDVQRLLQSAIKILTIAGELALTTYATYRLFKALTAKPAASVATTP